MRGETKNVSGYALVAALSKNRVIGVEGDLPWRLPADLAHFKQLTLGKPIVMGRRTAESLGRPLPGRRNIVLSRTWTTPPEGFELVSDPQSLIDVLPTDQEVMIIGGGIIYELFLPQADRLCLTLVDCEISGDTYFPAWSSEEWEEVSRETHRADDRHRYDYAFVEFRRCAAST